MEINGTQVIPASRMEVWNALNDPTILKQCLPGCESVEQSGEGAFRVVVATAIGPLRARFTGTLRMTEANPPQSCVMVFEGQGGAVGFGKGSTTVALSETSGGTELTYSAQAQVGGKLAQVGSRLIDGVAKKMSDDFFKAFRKQLAPDVADEALAASAAVKEAVMASRGKPARAAGSDGADTGNIAHIATPSTVAPQSGTPRPAAVAPLQAAPVAASGAGAATGGAVVVPGWWLGVAMLLGVFASFAGAHWMR
jgi:carbon monoxide dehydrogenase subunit G